MNEVHVKNKKNYRWVVAGLLLFATTINYMDRNVIAFLKEYFCSPEGFGWTNSDYANVTGVFTLFYSGFTLFAGYIIDKIGTKLGLALSLITWSLFGILNAFVGTTVSLHVFMRSLFGIGESGNFPASIKTVAEWFPKKERALATGIFNSGSNLGAMISALLVPFLLSFFGAELGWKMSFILTGAVGFLWLLFWFVLYDSPKKMLQKQKITQEEYDYINGDKEETTTTQVVYNNEKVSWFKLLYYKQTWSFFFGKFMTDGIWWFFLFWIPDYLKKQFALSSTVSGYLYFVILGVAIIGSVYGGSISMRFMTKGWEAYKARMASMLIIAVFPLLILSTQFFGNAGVFGQNVAIVLVVVILCVAGAAHQAWSANLFTTVSDMFPKKAVGSVTGIGAAAGGLGGFLVQKLAGSLTDSYASNPSVAYTILFMISGTAYLIAWAIMHFLVPKFKPVNI